MRISINRSYLRHFALLFTVVLAAISAPAADWYIATNGMDSNPGTQSAPLATLMQAQSLAGAGDTVFINAGTYFPTSQFPVESGVYVPVNLISKNGITYQAMPGTRPVFNFSLVNPPGLRTAAFWVTANNVTFQGFDVVALQENITNVNNQSVGFANWGCSFCTWNQVNVHDGNCVGIYFEELDVSNLVYRCDCYNLAGIDSFSFGNADGFGCHITAGGKGNIFRECRSWNNSDDGYDCIQAYETVTFDHCWSYKNGNNGGNGNGFKVGGWASTAQNLIPDPIPNHIVFNCLAVGNNGNAGFYANHQPAGPGVATGWTNNTAYANSVGYSLLQRTPPDYTTNGDETDDNDIAGTNEVMHYNLVYANNFADIENLNETGSMVSSNSWTESGVTISASDFVSLNASQMTNARSADGSLPVITLLHPVPGDPLTGLGCFVVPPAPTNLVATANNAQVALTWNASPGATGYNVKRSIINGGPYANVANDVTNLNDTDTGLTNGTTYYYVITALNPGDESTNSLPASAVPSPGPLISAASGSPNPVSPGQPVFISAAVTADPDPVTAVTVNASAIGGAASLPLFSDGTGNYTNSLTVGAATVPGLQTLTINAIDTMAHPSPPFPFTLTVTPVTMTWDGGGGDNNWSDAANWAGDVAPGQNASLVFAGVTRPTPLMDSSFNIFALTFDNTAGAFTIGTTGGNTLTLVSGLTNNSANVQTLNVPVILGAAMTVNAATADLTLGQNITNGGNALTLTDGGHNITVSGLISGTGGLTRSGTGTSVLSAANTFGGQTLITGGTLQLANPFALTNSTLNNTGGNVTFSAITAATLGGLTGSQNLALTNSANAGVALSVGANNSTATYSGALSGTGGSLIKTGTGTLTLNGANNYSGTTAVNAGVLRLSAGGVINGAAASVVDGAELIVNGGSLTASAAGNIGAGAATSLLVSAGTATFNGGLTTDLGQDTTELITVTGGSLTTASLALGRSVFIQTTLPGAGSTADGLYVNGGTVNITGNLDLSSSTTANSSASTRMDSGSLTIGGTMTIGLNNLARWSVLDVNGGVFTVTNSTTGISVGGPNAGNAEFLVRNGTASVGRIGLGFGTVTDAAVFELTNGSLYVGAGGIVQVSPNVNGTNILAGGILGATTNWSSSMRMTLANAKIQAADVLGNAQNILLSGTLTGTNLTKTGAGTLTLNGNNTYTGTTLVNAGKLLVNGTLAAGGQVLIANGGIFGGGGVINGPVTVQNGGTLAPGAPISLLTINNSLTLAAGSTSIFELKPAPLTNDSVTVSGTLTNGGTLIVTNISGTRLAAGEAFQLFNAASYTGTFSNVILPALPFGLAWKTNALNTNGTISVMLATTPVIGSISVSGNNLGLSGTGGVGLAGYILLGSTNLSTGNWTPLLTNQFDNSGNFNFTTNAGTTLPLNFYRLQLQ